MRLHHLIILSVIRWFAGLQVQPSGNLFVCNAGGKVGFLEITREEQVVWQSRGEVPLGHGIQRLDVEGADKQAGSA